ncbi:MAG: hypothetical protein B6D34_12890 [Candidatus Brocadia sp. UTAMX1]|jgi:hypothetical protein|nr:MAG: hypothetical protein B6D34_12890 [Candidatus Brocadia sp. UTAMX1]
MQPAVPGKSRNHSKKPALQAVLKIHPLTIKGFMMILTQNKLFLSRITKVGLKKEIYDVYSTIKK